MSRYCGVRLVYPGSRNRNSKVADIPRTGITGRWVVSVSPNGYVTRITFEEILEDLVNHLESKQVPRPVILFIDGFSGHLGPDIFDYCREQQIQLWLFKPNMTHVVQPLGMSHLKLCKLFLITKTLSEFMIIMQQLNPKLSHSFLAYLLSN